MKYLKRIISPFTKEEEEEEEAKKKKHANRHLLTENQITNG